METVVKFFEKISEYQILNYMIPGSVLCVLLKYLVGYDIIYFSIAENVIIVYFVGMVNSRLSSLVLKPFLEWTKIIQEAPYADYVRAEKKDAKLKVLSDINNMFRSMANVMVLLLLAYGLKHACCIEQFILNNFNWIAIVSLLIIFICSMRKQTNYVKGRVDANKD